MRSFQRPTAPLREAAKRSSALMADDYFRCRRAMAREMADIASPPADFRCDDDSAARRLHASTAHGSLAYHTRWPGLASPLRLLRSARFTVSGRHRLAFL